ncbi:MAG: class I SAM-dependent methyltransferase [Chlorobiaceae bacterium]|nr:class I SAM-dependent methyltransferase [Chlorobiaceae bacterium]
MTSRASHSREEHSREWFEEWFDHPLYLQAYLHRDQDEAARCARTILDLTGLNHVPPPLSVLDIACGAGRHALEFARLGLVVTANDLSPFLLNRAKELALNEGLPMEFTLQDMRKIRTETRFNLIVQLFSSFGYFESDREDRDIIANISTMLRPDGWYVLDLLNPYHLKRHFVPRTERKAGVLAITEERSLTERHVTKRITLHEENGREHSFTESVRIYTPDEATELLGSNGFRVERIVGDYDGHAFNHDLSPRMMLFARPEPSRS